jgi:hypothetical protein
LVQIPETGRRIGTSPGFFGALAPDLKQMFKLSAARAEETLVAANRIPPMRLLSFLSDIERAIRMEANADEGAIWDTARIVNFKSGLGRLTLTCREADSGMPQGTVLIQHFGLANGSFCLKASLNWQGCDTSVTLSVYETPVLNWKLEASRIGTAWMAGPPAAAAGNSEERVAAVG